MNDILFKNKLRFFVTKGYRMKVGKNSYILFEKEEDYLNMFYLEKVLFDFYSNVIFKKDNEVGLLFRLSLIEKYIKSLPEFKIKIFHDERKSENPFKIKFPNICYSDDFKMRGDFYDVISEMEDRNFNNSYLLSKYRDLNNLIIDIITVEYYKRMVKVDEYFRKNVMLIFSEIN